MKKKVLFIDHFDSFSQNLVAAIQCEGFEVDVVQSNALAFPQCVELLNSHDGVVFSPGPGHPSEYESSLKFYKLIPPSIPVLGVCLGHQLMLFSDGALVGRLSNGIPVHGRRMLVENKKPSRLLGDFSGTEVFYNSLRCQVAHAPETWDVLAWYEDEVLVVEHKALPRVGFQFHPESFASRGGLFCLRAFLRLLGS